MSAFGRAITFRLAQRVEEQGRLPTVRIERTIVVTPPVDYTPLL